jgi:hypothetical protein
MDFITGNKFKINCHHSYDEEGYIIHSEPLNGEILRIFVKIDYVHGFFNKNVKIPYILFTHNGDLPIDGSYLDYLDNKNLIKWYGQNVMVNHPKIKSIPIGIANEIWPHGDEKIFEDTIRENLLKDRLIYINFDIETNKMERNYCLNKLSIEGLNMSDKLPFKEYLREVAKSYFIISPNGNGIDCHKIWEALYLKTVPIITKSINSDFYADLPIVVLNNWDDFNLSLFTIEKYNKIWKKFNIEQLNVKNFLKYD